MPPYCHSTANVLPQVVTENYVLNTLIVILVLNYAWTLFFFFFKIFPILFLSEQYNGMERHSCSLKLFTDTAVSVAALYILQLIHPNRWYQHWLSQEKIKNMLL